MTKRASKFVTTVAAIAAALGVSSAKDAFAQSCATGLSWGASFGGISLGGGSITQGVDPKCQAMATHDPFTLAATTLKSYFKTNDGETHTEMRRFISGVLDEEKLTTILGKDMPESWRALLENPFTPRDPQVVDAIVQGIGFAAGKSGLDVTRVLGIGFAQDYPKTAKLLNMREGVIPAKVSGLKFGQ